MVLLLHDILLRLIALVLQGLFVKYYDVIYYYVSFIKAFCKILQCEKIKMKFFCTYLNEYGYHDVVIETYFKTDFVVSCSFAG